MTDNKENKISIITKNKSLDYGLLIVVLILLAIGLVMVLSASAYYSLRNEGDSYYYFRKQLYFAAGGIALMYIISRMNYKILNSRISYFIFGLSLVLLALVFVPGIGVTRNDATRWIRLGGIQFQPSEIMKVAMILALARFISKDPNRIKNFWNGLVPCIVIFGVIALILLKQPHMSATMIIGVIFVAMIFAGGAKLRHIIPVGILGAIGAYILAMSSDYRVKRMMIFLDPFQDIQGDGWQIVQSIYAISSGGLFGVGLGKSVQKYSYIPEPHNDFIFAIFAEEFGLFGALIVMLLFGIFIWRGITIALKAPDMFGALVAVGITTMIGIQAIFSIAVVSSSMPVTGIPLPFFSYGGTSLLMLLGCVGLLLAISRHNKK